MKSLNRAQQRTRYALRGSTDRSPYATVKRLYCIEGCGLQNARKVGKSADYTLDCGHTRALMSSEKETTRAENE